MAMVPSIPRENTAIQYMAAREKLTKMLTAIAKIGIITYLYPQLGIKHSIIFPLAKLGR